MKDLSNYRKSYEKSALLEDNIPTDPINLFHRWFHEVQDFGGIDEVNAMTVAKISSSFIETIQRRRFCFLYQL
jgi:pyridoxamine 5'-phosphate oxidase